ncbi:MAG: hypothetical protein ACM3MM_07870, partial [Acidobacteriota bacterium]
MTRSRAVQPVSIHHVNDWFRGRGSMMLAADGDVLTNVIIAASVGAIGALIAGLTALAQSWFASRDARLRATAQLDLATRRTNFVAQWLDAHEKMGDADGRLANIYRLADAELEEAYDEAQRGSTALHDVVKESFSESFTKTLRGLLLLKDGLRLISKFVVAGFYLSLVLFGFLIVGSEVGYQDAIDCQQNPSLDKCPDPPDDPSDYLNLSLWQWVFVSVAALFLLRVLFGVWVNWLQRGDRSSPQAGSTSGSKPSPLTEQPQTVEASMTVPPDL